MKIVALLPARLHSTRIKTKCLKEIDGIPIIIHTLSRVKLAKGIDDIFVCTDSDKIKELIEKFGEKALISSKKHNNGTERISEFAKKIKADLFIDVHSDEAFLDPKNIDKLIEFHKRNKSFDIVVPHKISKSSGGKNIVKLLINKFNEVIYFTRSSCPFGFRKKTQKYFHHLDIISFKPSALTHFSKLEIGNLERLEGIELLRALENKMKVGSFPIKTNSFSINTPEDFTKAKKTMRRDKIFQKYYGKI